MPNMTAKDQYCAYPKYGIMGYGKDSVLPTDWQLQNQKWKHKAQGKRWGQGLVNRKPLSPEVTWKCVFYFLAESRRKASFHPSHKGNSDVEHKSLGNVGFTRHGWEESRHHEKPRGACFQKKKVSSVISLGFRVQEHEGRQGCFPCRRRQETL